MLVHLSIHNYALIGSLELAPGPGMNIITGETGAGKSILLGALGLILGERADSQSLKDRSKKCIIEGKFNLDKYDLEPLFHRLDLDYSEESIFRREVTAEGKSRAFINDTPVTLQVLKEIGSRLVDVHSQHETLLLNHAYFQVMLLDLYAGNESLFNKYTSAWTEHRKLSSELIKCEEEEMRSAREKDYLEFQFSELDEAQLLEGEQEKHESELSSLEHADGIRKAVNAVSEALAGSDKNILTTLSQAKNTLAPFIKFNKKAGEISNRLQSALLELKDVNQELDSVLSDLDINPDRKTALEERLDLLYRLQQKHRVNTAGELNALREELAKKLEGITSLGEQIIRIRKNLEASFTSLEDIASKLRESRMKAVKTLENEILAILEALAIPNASFVIDIRKLNVPGMFGTEEVRFLFSANRGMDPKELGKVASGGELSRLMLALKSVIARLSSLPTIIFDEIDSGVSGMIAGKVAGIMEKMGEKMQVITITHLPQVASKGSTHFLVYKKEKGRLSETYIRELSKDERIKEVAKMLSAGEPSKAAISNAKELLDKNG